NDGPVAHDDSVTGSVVQAPAGLTFEDGTYTENASYDYNTGQYIYTVTTGDFSFTSDGDTNYGWGPSIAGGWGADNTYSLYSEGYDGYYNGGTSTTTPIAMARADGALFSLDSANITSYSDSYYYGYTQTDYETVTGYLNGVQVAQQSFYVPDANYGTYNNTVTFTDLGFDAVDKVVFSLTNSAGYYSSYVYQWRQQQRRCYAKRRPRG
ncbi:hypothetical protein JZU54_01030, partial [bacterium]|nr:hypothetical protein [bacterium]